MSAKRFVLAALLALASHALAPYLHALSSGCDEHAPACSGAESEQAPSHSPDCAVCGAIAQAGVRTLSAPGALAAPTTDQSFQAVASDSLVGPEHPARESSRARAPPVLPLTA